MAILPDGRIFQVDIGDELLCRSTFTKYFASGTTLDTVNVFNRIVCLNDVVFKKLKRWRSAIGNNAAANVQIGVSDDTAATELADTGSPLNGVTVKAGTILYGYFTGVELTSGNVECHSKYPILAVS